MRLRNNHHWPDMRNGKPLLCALILLLHTRNIGDDFVSLTSKMELNVKSVSVVNSFSRNSGNGSNFSTARAIYINISLNGHAPVCPCATKAGLGARKLMFDVSGVAEVQQCQNGDRFLESDLQN